MTTVYHNTDSVKGNKDVVNQFAKYGTFDKAKYEINQYAKEGTPMRNTITNPNPLNLPMTIIDIKCELEWMIDGLEQEARRLQDDIAELMQITERGINSPTLYNQLMMMIGDIELKLDKLDEDMMELEMQLSDII